MRHKMVWYNNHMTIHVLDLSFFLVCDDQITHDTNSHSLCLHLKHLKFTNLNMQCLTTFMITLTTKCIIESFFIISKICYVLQSILTTFYK
jgi:hypothetical protein